jgi:hypothetical protein
LLYNDPEHWRKRAEDARAGSPDVRPRRQRSDDGDRQQLSRGARRRAAGSKHRRADQASGIETAGHEMALRPCGQPGYFPAMLLPAARLSAPLPLSSLAFGPWPIRRQSVPAGSMRSSTTASASWSGAMPSASGCSRGAASTGLRAIRGLCIRRAGHLGLFLFFREAPMAECPSTSDRDPRPSSPLST